ncbi:MAG: 3-keto-5-aminohexanoate cleavage protein [Deltaproteobacteria bacterium RBG_16_54_11]|nr:MAG: 3-keto-5-aminohexanoate cleavage protein [Deltaproteobacteria bacterium RBG_16_54_11]
MAKVIVTAALTGGGSTPSMSPYLPITPQQLADEAVRAYEAGAAIAHVHVRNSETGQPCSNLEYFREIATKVKSKCNIVICFTTGGTPEMTVAERARVVAELNPELATFNAGSMNFGIFPGAEGINEYKYNWEKPHLLNSENSIFPNTFRTLREFSQMFAQTNTKPELEVYDSGMIHNLAYLVQKGYLKKPLHIQFVLGTMGGLPATVNNLNFLYHSARETLGEFTWSTCAIGRFQFPMCTVAMIMGGNTRVGMEDNLYVSKGVLAKSNAELVEKMVRILREFGNEPACPDEARKILGLKGLDQVNY